MEHTVTVTKTLEEQGNFVHLPECAEYEKYFAVVSRAISILITWYQRIVKGGNDEEQIVAGFLHRLLNTIKLLSLKHNCSEGPKLRLDLNDSGFPHLMGIMGLEMDLRQREEELKRIDSPAILRERMLDHMLSGSHTEPTELMALLSYRSYLEQLKEEKVLLPFTPGELVLKSQDEKVRHYTYSWCCYDLETNIPYVYIMAFDQDVAEEGLHEKGASYSHFMNVVRGEGSRAPQQLSVVAIGIDTSIASVHPKVLKRIKLGPLISLPYTRDEHPLLKYLKEFGEEGDFIFHIRDEMVYSQRQDVTKGGFFTADVVHEIFAVPQDDIECAEAGASRIHRMMVLPHHLVQHLNQEEGHVAQYNSKVTYTKKGEVYAV